ncbi:MAG: glycine cleavage system protein GcvH [SAR202 cluster bacterium]|jgi:glycine cleavage system H protein|nr:glycine cleavage system protein GcvH [SAR202 cluster bacterium]|tara:strand:- start:6679 stop:7062 length:384 start_codon:yes stop_codon:yes gene_type:complete
MNPSEFKYSEEHEWVNSENNGEVIVGITDFAAETLGDVVFVELPDVGAEVKQFTKFGEIESVKAVSDLYSPISGSIVKVNENLVSKPELVNQDAYGDGWLIKILPTNLQELDSLMSSTDYKKFTESQ